MASVPNLQNSLTLSRLCDRFNLTDPFRIINPDSRNFSYQPFGHVRLNRSRIDFFCISNGLIDSIIDCKIGSSPLFKGFDHKFICLKLGKPTILKKEKTLSNQFLKAKILRYCIEVGAIRAHLFSVDQASPDNSFLLPSCEQFLVREKDKIRNIRSKIGLEMAVLYRFSILDISVQNNLDRYV